jgi:Cu/Ag efflux protein CusF
MDRGLSTVHISTTRSKRRWRAAFAGLGFAATAAGENLMRKYILPLTVIGLMAATSAQAQFGGIGDNGGSVGGGGSGGGRHGGRGSHAPASSGPSATPEAAPVERPKPVEASELVGVVKAIDPDTGRITIAYEASDARGWPAGTMPFVVGKTALLKAATVGQKVRFKLESEQISALAPY